MKQSIAYLIIITIFLVGCTPQFQNEVPIDNGLKTEIKTIIMQSDFWKLFYIGRYSFPTETYTVTQNERVYRSFDIRYSEISQDLIDVCKIDFGELREYESDYYFASLPFDSIKELKENIENVYTEECAENVLYCFYDDDYVEYNNTILRAFDSDTITAYTTDYETMKIIEYTKNKIKAVVKAYHHLDNSKLDITYEFVLDDNIWKINSIEYLDWNFHINTSKVLIDLYAIKGWFIERKMIQYQCSIKGYASMGLIHTTTLKNLNAHFSYNSYIFL